MNYKEKLAEAKRLYQTATPDQKYVLESLFPELCESEDEKIRRELIDYINRLTASPNNIDKYNTWIAWLEKQAQTFTKKDVDDAYLKGVCDAKQELENQGEQKPNYCHHEVDLSGCSEEYRKAYYDGWNNCNTQHSQCKSELNDVVKCLINGMKFYYEDNEEATWGTEKWSMPVKHIIEVLEKQGVQKSAKFHEGEWIVWQDKCYKVNYNGCGYELIDQNGLSTSLEYGTVDTSARLWDITKDAKDGDVLVSQYNKPFIYNGNRDSFHVGSYCGISVDDRFNVSTEKCHWTGNVSIHPATKEQRDTLLTKMKESGYTFDFEKKELEITDFSKHLKYDPDAPSITEQKPAWSEEDEEMLTEIITDVKFAQERNPQSQINQIIFEEETNWLKSIKDRITWRPSEGQMKALEYIINNAHNTSHSCKIAKELLEQLKKL